jgi:SAM-dependent methyltransferase
MGKQEDIFLESEGDAWFERNIYKVREDIHTDPVIQLMLKHFNPGEYLGILEVGCSNGWRLNEIQKIYGWACYGVDPSLKAIANGNMRFGKNEKLYLTRGTALAHPWHTYSMDMIVFGFCLYVCDPEELFEIVTQADNALHDGGYIIIHDFDADCPHSVPNQHVEGLMTYKMDWSRLWLSNPFYSLVEKVSFADGTAVWLLKKDQKKAFPCASVSSDLDQ